MRFSAYFLLLGLIFCFGDSLASAAPQHEKTDEADQETAVKLVLQLGDSQYKRRESAAKRLLRMGPSAIDAVENFGLTSLDREIKIRSEILLVLLYKVAQEKSLADFITGKSDDFPGWKLFRSLVGDEGAVARGLFIEMLKEDETLLSLYFDSPKSVHTLLSQKIASINQLSSQQAPVSNVSLATVLFLMTRSELFSMSNQLSTLAAILARPQVKTSLTSGPRKELFLKLVSAVVLHKNMPLVNTLALATDYGLNDASTLATRALKDKRQMVRIRVFAIMALARSGDVSQVDFLETFLDEKTVIGSARVTKQGKLPAPAPNRPPPRRRPVIKVVQVQLQDAVLAAMLYLTKQNLADYGFYHPHNKPVFNPTIGMQNLCFEDDNKRILAIKHWKAYRLKENNKKD